MKKYAIVIFSIIIAVCSFTGLGYASAQNEESSENISAVESITFRDIDWYTPYPEASTALQNMGDIGRSSVFERIMLSNWDIEGPEFVGEPYFSGGGVQIYTTASVAGYNASLFVNFIYAIIDGHVSWDMQSSELIKVIYKIQDLGDMEAAYDDLKSKLSHLYGEGTITSSYDSYYKRVAYEGVNWFGSDGSVVRITIQHKVTEDSRAIIEIIYSAPNTAERITELIKQDELDKAAEEAEKREENADNYDGL